jgi:hypothetical protein
MRVVYSVSSKRWPDGNAYVEAVQNTNNLGDAELRAGKFEQRANGLPKPYSGGFTTTFHFTTLSGGYAVRCFTRGSDDLERRYHAITEFLRLVHSKAFCQAEYLPLGIRVEGQWWPIIKMAWVTGSQINTEVEMRLNDPAAIKHLAENFRAAVRALSVLGVAHGDLQHGNIIVANGELRLIDYDGIYLPALYGMLPSEFGHQNYQHPSRPRAPFDGRLDRFSSIVIYTAMQALASDPSLWARFNNDENMLFRAHDFTSNGSSDLFRALLSNAATSKLASGLANACAVPFDQVPTLDQVIQSTASGASFSPLISPQVSQAPSQAPVAAAPSRRPLPQPIMFPSTTPQAVAASSVQMPPINYHQAPNQPAAKSQKKRGGGGPVLALAMAALLAAAIIAWPHPASNRSTGSDVQGGSGTVAVQRPVPSSRLAPTGSCETPNQADSQGMEDAIRAFHKYVETHKWESAAWYENTDDFLPLSAMERGYAHTQESSPTIVNTVGCLVTVALKFQDEGQPQNCLRIEYTMEFARNPEPRWIIHDAQSLGSPQVCT